MDMNKTTKTTKSYGLGSWSLTAMLLVIFAIIGGILCGWTGVGVGIVMVLAGAIISWVGLIPFGGIPIYMFLYNYVLDWLYVNVPQAASMLAPDALPRIALYWIFGAVAVIGCVIFSVIVIALIIAGIIVLLDR